MDCCYSNDSLMFTHGFWIFLGLYFEKHPVRDGLWKLLELPWDHPCNRRSVTRPKQSQEVQITSLNQATSVVIGLVCRQISRKVAAVYHDLCWFPMVCWHFSCKPTGLLSVNWLNQLDPGTDRSVASAQRWSILAADHRVFCSKRRPIALPLWECSSMSCRLHFCAAEVLKL